MNIKQLHWFFTFLLFCLECFGTVIAQTDSAAGPQIYLLPSVVRLEYSGNEFLTSSVKVLNKGAVPLIISHVKPSCLCISGVIERSTIPPLGFGTLRLNINTSAIKDSLSRVDLYIYSNQSKDPASLPVYLIKTPRPATDSIKTN